MIWTCPQCAFRLDVPVWPVLCRCGLRAWEDGYTEQPVRTARPKREPRPLAEVLPLAAICLSCEFLRQHRRGARCTHKRCGCCGDETGEPVELHGVLISRALVNRLERGKCPDGLW